MDQVYNVLMTSYKDSGVDITKGDRASSIARDHALKTFAGRKDRIGLPVTKEDSFAGLLDMRDHYLVQTTDSTGTKIDLAFDMNTFDTIGYDLLAMVADDAVCTGAEVFSVSNCLDIPSIDTAVVDRLLAGLSRACQEQHIAMSAGEIAEVPGAVLRGVWSATGIGIVQKENILKPEDICEGDQVIALRSGVARSNGFSLIRKILIEKFGESWCNEEWKDGLSWGEIMLTPSVIYHHALLKVLGRYEQERVCEIKGLAHITGGGIPSKLGRILKKSQCGVKLTDLWDPHPAISDLIEIGGVPLAEAYNTWNMGNGMLAVVSPSETDTVIAELQKEGLEAKFAGEITKEKGIKLKTYEETEMTL
jgi:phosphoribosylformylglycinamidine cyclo-ligase